MNHLLSAFVALLLACGGPSRGASPSSDHGRWPPADASAGERDRGARDASPASTDGASPNGQAPLDLQIANKPGEEVEIEGLLVAGKVTVIEFFADWCKPCKEVDRRMRMAMSKESAIAMRKIDIGEDSSSPVARQHGVSAIPHVLIYDGAGSLRYTLTGQQTKQAAEIAQHLARR